MHAQAIDFSEDRRVGDNDFELHYSRLSGDQIATLYSLTQLGYVLKFVRVQQNAVPLAFAFDGEKCACVSESGTVEYNPPLKIRK